MRDKRRFIAVLLIVLAVLSRPFDGGKTQASAVHGEISFQRILNARDLGGYRTKDGRVVRKKLLLRSGELSYASKADLKKLRTKYKLKTVIDLRLVTDYEYCPDKRIKGVTYRHIPAKYKASPKASTARKRYKAYRKLSSRKLMKKAAANMKKVGAAYTRSLLLDEYSQKAYREYFQILLANTKRKGILFHCIHGKDRTGVAAFLTLLALGVNEETAYRDYAMTNTWLEEHGLQAGDEGAVGVCEQDLREAVALAKQQYGAVERFLEEAYGLNQEALRELRRIYTK